MRDQTMTRSQLVKEFEKVLQMTRACDNIRLDYGSVERQYSRLTPDEIEEWAKENDSDYGRCETCKNYGHSLDCDICDEESGYEFDLKHYEKAPKPTLISATFTPSEINLNQREDLTEVVRIAWGDQSDLFASYANVEGDSGVAMLSNIMKMVMKMI